MHAGLWNAAGIAVGLIALAGCASSAAQSQARLRLSGDGRGGGFGQDYVPVARPITAITMNVCTQGGAVRVRSVRLNGARRLELVDWGTRLAGPGMRGGQPGIATEVGFTHHPIDRPCSGETYAILAVSVERTGSTAGTARSLTVTFTGGAIDVPFGLALCPAKCTNADLGMPRS